MPEGDRAKHLAVFAGLDGNEADELGEALGQVGHGVKLVGFALGPALPQGFNAAFVGRRQQ